LNWDSEYDNMKLDILLVEDSKVTVRIVSMILKKSKDMQYNLTHADSIDAALSLLNENEYDVILLDLNLPDSKGIETFYKTQKVSKGAAIIVESGNDDEYIAITTIQNGAQDYISKKNLTSELMNGSIRYAVERKRIEDELKYRFHFEQIITSISSYLISLGHDETDIGISRTLQQIVNFSKVDRCSFIILNDEVNIVNYYEWCVEGIESGFSNIDKVALKQSLPWFFSQTEDLYETNISAIDELPPEASTDRDFFESLKIKSFAALPLIDKENLRAIICFETVEAQRVFKDDDLSLLRVVGEILINFLGSKLLEKSREENEIMLSTILNSIHSGILVVDAKSKLVVRANDSAINMINAAKDDILGADINRFLVVDVENLLSDIQDLSCSKMKETQLKVSEDRTVPVLLSSTIIMSESGKHLVLCLTDITERKIAEYELAHDQKLKSIGSLAAGIAHEINTPTQFVSDNTRFLQDAFGDFDLLYQKYRLLVNEAEKAGQFSNLIAEIKTLTDEIDVEFLNEEIPTSINQSLDGLSRISNIVNAMRDYAHPEIKEMKSSNINKLIENAITVGRNEWKYSAKIVTEFDDSIPPISCLPGEISQVILNMLINAVHAIQDTFEEGCDQMGLIKIKTGLDDNWIEISISDNGSGIPQKIKNSIFDPFFTTKEVGKGTGQGLALVRNVIVEKHGGSISLESEKGEGTTFILRLPAKKTADDKILTKV